MSSFISKTIGPNSPLGRRASGIFGKKGGDKGKKDEKDETTGGVANTGGDNNPYKGDKGDNSPPTVDPLTLNRSFDPSVIRTKDTKTSAGETYLPQAHQPTSPPANMFNLRVGPNYKKMGKKAPSGPELYKFDKCDLVQTSSSRLNVISGEGQFQHFVPELGAGRLEGTRIPAKMIVTANLPTDSPSMFNTPEEGPSFVIVFYFAASEALVAEAEKIKNGTCVDPSVLLLNKWCSVAETNRNEMGR